MRLNVPICMGKEKEMAARSAECKCESNFTCRYCLRKAKPWYFTCSTGAVITDVPADLRTGEK